MAQEQQEMSSLIAVSFSDYSKPKPIETSNEDFVTNGVNNEYFRFLADLYVTSTTNRAACDEISRNIYGKGLSIAEEVEKPIEEDEKKFGFSKYMPNFLGGGGKKSGEMVTETEYKEEDPVLDEINELINAKDLQAFIKDRIVFGQASFKLLYKGAGSTKKLVKIKHFPIQTLAAKKISVDKVRKEATKKKKDDYEFKGEVEAHFYCPRWEDYKPGTELTEIPAYGYGKSYEIYICKDYVPNAWYFNPVEWSGAVDYAIAEKEIGEYLVNDLQNGFSPTTLININRSFDSWDKREQFIYDMKARLSGSKGDKNLIQFNSSEEEKTTFEAFPISDAVDRFEYLAQESSRKILSGHRVPEPKLLGIPSPGEQGLGNNAKEIEVAFEKFKSTVIEPFQMEILDSLKELLKINGIEEEITFIPITPLDFDKHTQNEALSMNNYNPQLDNGEMQDKGNNTDKSNG